MHILTIKGFRCEDTEKLFLNIPVRRFQAIESTARRKLKVLNAASKLEDLMKPPGNRLEALRRERGGQYSIRINNQWRICFRWKDSAAHDVEIVDYH
ncbi:MAG: type II toxin-antitoxin system RelE/ParE family toxin [Candidatus Tectomicrobia bacterium]|nr:type II toxin-antitoxin system RelE/ParE family toxin [Candidatus Tectomicrobia bacterium]